MLQTDSLPSGSLTDGYGRILDYLRLSLTDSCNYQCVYCGPGQSQGTLGDDQFVHLCRIFKKLGVRTLRLTGGEPLLRKNLPSLVAALSQLGFDRMEMTTNGSLLPQMAFPLAQAGLHGINLSLDATDATLFSTLSGGGRVEPVLQGIKKAKEAGLYVKLNCVPLLDSYQSQVVQVMELAKANAISVRFIELMPIGNGCSLKGVPIERLQTFLEQQYGSPQQSILGDEKGRGPATYHRYDSVEVGLIGALSACFCETCNRLRLTSNGLLKSCLYHQDTLDLRQLLENGNSDESIELAIHRFIAKKTVASRFFLAGNDFLFPCIHWRMTKCWKE
ncbi:radical SAM protein [uncultured Sphaerochaeta sp.]|uniref:GTP 3',8-cyclase MoaA n=1 Tax=uncultured Sphaerochaeta sp. TaxID=886478 RepID=UPI002A0A2B0D|nr:radical SAM protein [uncultured Sphaerochaeta sp.]